MVPKVDQNQSTHSHLEMPQQGDQIGLESIKKIREIEIHHIFGTAKTIRITMSGYVMVFNFKSL